MGKAYNLIGQTFGSLTVLGKSEKQQKNADIPEPEENYFLSVLWVAELEDQCTCQDAR